MTRGKIFGTLILRQILRYRTKGRASAQVPKLAPHLGTWALGHLGTWAPGHLLDTQRIVERPLACAFRLKIVTDAFDEMYEAIRTCASSASLLSSSPHLPSRIN